MVIAIVLAKMLMNFTNFNQLYIAVKVCDSIVNIAASLTVASSHRKSNLPTEPSSLRVWTCALYE